MFEEVKKLYVNGTYSLNDIRRAVIVGWITKDQYKQIIGREY